MTTLVTTGYGGTLKIGNAAAVLTAIAEVINVPIPSGTTELIDATHMGTTGFRDYIQSPLRDGEEADIEVNWIPGSATDILLRDAVGATRLFEIIVPAGDGATTDGTYKFTGSLLVRNYTRTNALDDKRTGTLAVKWVSAITETYVAPV